MLVHMFGVQVSFCSLAPSGDRLCRVYASHFGQSGKNIFWNDINPFPWDKKTVYSEHI